MDFNRFGTVEPYRSLGDSFFTNQAIRAGYSIRDHVGRHRLETTVSAREALRWDMEKHKIRAELIADNMRRHQLVEEVRRELAFERELALRRERRLLYSLASATRDAKAENRFSLGTKLLPESSSVIDRLRPEAGTSSEQAFPETRAAEKAPVVLPVKTLKATLGGAKRKASALPTAAKGTDTVAEKELPWLAIPRKKTKTSQIVWTCTLCNVSCTSEDGLADHRLGKKHRAKVEESQLRNGEGPSDKVDVKTPQPNASKAVGVPTCGLGAAKNLRLKKTPGSKKQLKVEQAGPTPKTQRIKDQVKGRFTFLCEHCGVECNSEIVRDSHLSGKRHATRLEELKKRGNDSGTDLFVERTAKGTGQSDAVTVTQEADTGNEGEEALKHKENEVAETGDD